MIIKSSQEVPAKPVGDLKGVEKQILIGPEDGSEEIVMRQLTLQPRAHTPYHEHAFPHLVKVEEGIGVVIDQHGHEHALEAGNVIYVHDNEVHGFKNTGNRLFRFICIVPSRGEK